MCLVVLRFLDEPETAVAAVVGAGLVQVDKNTRVPKSATTCGTEQGRWGGRGRGELENRPHAQE